MKMSSATKELPDYLSSTRELLERAFPDGVREADYLPLVAALSENMSIRNLADVISNYTETSWPRAYNDVLLVLSDGPVPAPTAVERVKQKLLPYGYQEWLQAE